jgi:hypothetical protein
MGEAGTEKLLMGVVTAAFVLLISAAASGILPKLGYALAACPLFIFLVLGAYRQGIFHPGIRLEFLVESHLVLAGVITFLATFTTA